MHVFVCIRMYSAHMYACIRMHVFACIQHVHVSAFIRMYRDVSKNTIWPLVSNTCIAARGRYTPSESAKYMKYMSICTIQGQKKWRRGTIQYKPGGELSSACATEDSRLFANNRGLKQRTRGAFSSPKSYPSRDPERMREGRWVGGGKPRTYFLHPRL